MPYKIEQSVKVENGRTYILKERMQDIVWGCDLERSSNTVEEYEKAVEEWLQAHVIYDKITDTGRWSEYHECVFELNGKTYMTDYSRGATEMQDESPYEYDGEWIAVTEVVPKEVTVIKYVAK